jgi:hypothetical protein
MVDLDHVISGSFAIANNNREVKFDVAKPVKTIKTSVDWFIAWGKYSVAACYVVLHWQEEFLTYRSRILSLFSATAPASHAALINLDKSI